MRPCTAALAERRRAPLAPHDRVDDAPSTHRTAARPNPAYNDITLTGDGHRGEVVFAVEGVVAVWDWGWGLGPCSSPGGRVLQLASESVEIAYVSSPVVTEDHAGPEALVVGSVRN